MLAFLESDQIAVPRRVWLALPIELRYHTPAADLYRRRKESNRREEKRRDEKRRDETRRDEKRREEMRREEKR